MSNSSFRNFFEKEFEQYTYFNIEKKELIFKHLEQKIDLNISDNFMSNEEKKELQFDTNFKITKELIDIFDKEKIIGLDPKRILLNLFHKIRTQEYKRNEIEHFKEIGVNYYRLLSSCDNKTCKGCTKLSKRIFSVNDDINEILRHECTSAYCRCYLHEITDDEEQIENISLSKKDRKERFDTSDSITVKGVAILLLIFTIGYYLIKN